MAMQAMGTLMTIAQGFKGSQMIYTVSKLGVADLLKDGPKSDAQLATALKAHPDNLSRLLRATAALGIFTRDPNTLLYSLNDVSSLLLEGPTSMKYPVLHLCEPATIQAWLHLEGAIMEGKYPFVAGLGASLFEFYKKNPECDVRFNRAMTSFSNLSNHTAALAKHYDFKAAKRVVDVGGGQGALSVGLLRAYPDLLATSFDLPHVVEDAKERHANDYVDVQSRLSFVGGSFFESVPEGGDYYLLKQIIHDWGDTKAIEILKTIAKALPPHGKVIVIDRVIEEVGDTFGGLLDIHMMVMCDAKERTAKEWDQVFNAAGLKVTRKFSLAPIPTSVVEGEKL